MKYLLLLAIRLYWAVIPPSKRKRCIFRESCSQYVWRIADSEGFIVGINAFLFRNKHCCPGYTIYKYQGHYELKTVSGMILKEEDIAEWLLTTENPSLIDFDSPDFLKSNCINLH